MWFNSQTIRVPFASITGTTFYLAIGARGHGMGRAITAVQTGYDDPRFGTPGHTWDELAAIITNLQPLLTLMSRILRGLLGLKERTGAQTHSPSSSERGTRGALIGR
jgi:hypothetical protein